MAAATLEKNFHSALFMGWVGHRRFKPREHSFRYRVFMCYFDLDELDAVLQLSPFWSRKAFALARFKRRDYLDGENGDLKTAVLKTVNSRLGMNLDGPVRMLTNLRYFGYIMNPLTIYYCFDKQQHLRALLLEVTNTPWGERHHYALACDPDNTELRTNFTKEFHVSPFHDMNIEYEWRSNLPEQLITVYMRNLRSHKASEGSAKELIFDASLNLERRALSASCLNKVLLAYPFMTLKVFISIYWQAIKLLFKRMPIYGHPTEYKKEKHSGIN